MDMPIVDLTDDIKRAPVERAEKALTELRLDMREAKSEFAAELMPIILILREAME